MSEIRNFEKNGRKFSEELLGSVPNTGKGKLIVRKSADGVSYDVLKITSGGYTDKKRAEVDARKSIEREAVEKRKALRIEKSTKRNAEKIATAKARAKASLERAEKLIAKANEMKKVAESKL